MSENEPQLPASPAPQGPPPSEWRPDGPSGPRASFGRRLGALLIDSAIILVVVGVLWVVNETLGVIAYLLGIFVYTAFFEGRSAGQTPGKMAVGIRVVDYNTGGPIGYGRAILRWLCRILSSIPCYLGYFWMLWDKEKQTWHDKLSTSVVVPVQYYPVP